MLTIRDVVRVAALERRTHAPALSTWTTANSFSRVRVRELL